MKNLQPSALEMLVADKQSAPVPVDAEAQLDAILEDTDGNEVSGVDADVLAMDHFAFSLISGIQIVQKGGRIHLEKGNCFFQLAGDDTTIKVHFTGTEFQVRAKAKNDSSALEIFDDIIEDLAPSTGDEPECSLDQRPRKRRRVSRAVCDSIECVSPHWSPASPPYSPLPGSYSPQRDIYPSSSYSADRTNTHPHTR
jgi:hypothetical protein